MRFLVIGLGSMGKRRIRNLNANGEYDIWAVDTRKDRREEAEQKYGVKTFEKIEDIDLKEVNAFIISVPPDLHMRYAHMAFENNAHCFIEASVTDEGMLELIEKTKKNPAIKVCPSCTFRHHPSIKLIKDIVQSGKIGKISHYSYHSGQYLPDWHPWEKITEFYVSKKETGACREIVPFEMTWLNWVFGDIAAAFGFKDKTISLDADIDDVYTITMKYKTGVLGTLIVDVVARSAVRKLVINGEEGQIVWDWNEKAVKVYYAKERRWVIYQEPQGKAELGYNANIIEEMYIDEIKSYIDAAKGISEWSNSLEDDYKLLQCLYGIENASDTGICARFD